MRAYILTVIVVDHDNIEARGAGAIGKTIEMQRYPNHCISPSVVKSEAFDIGPWGTEEDPDCHPLNHMDTDELSWLRANGVPIDPDLPRKEWEAESRLRQEEGEEKARAVER